MVTCDVCGSGNDPKLTFCRNCGHRLKAQQSRAVPATPATGLKKVDVQAQSAGGDLSWDAPEAPPARRSRPSAPPLLFGQKDGAAAGSRRNDASAAATPAAADNVPTDKRQCAQCGALSPRNYRFCISCGAVLKKEASQPPPRPETAPPTVRKQPPPPKSARAKPKSAKPPPRAKPTAAPSARAGAPPSIECPSCGGQVRSTEAFCKYCGSSLKGVKREADTIVDDAAKAQIAGAPDRAVDLKRKVGGDGDPFPLSESAVEDEPQARPRPSVRRPPPKGEVTGMLVVIVEDGSEGRAIELRGRQVDIGSSEGDILLSEDRYLSPRHSRFFRQDGEWYLRDLGSINGVYRRLRKPAPLRDGDLVLLGLEVLQFDLVDHAERGLGHAIQHGVLVFGSPATTRRARLCQRTVEGVVRDVYHLVADETTIGRETGDIVFTSDPFMSRKHASVSWDEDAQGYVLADLNSSNGTYLAVRDDVRLENGDYIRLGQHLFRVDLPSRAKAR